MNATPKTHGEAYEQNHNGYRDKIQRHLAAAAEYRETDEWKAYMAAHLPADFDAEEVAPVREP